MMTITRNTLFVRGVLMGLVLLMGLGLSSVQAAPSALPPRPTAVPTLPPAPVWSPSITGGMITLRVTAPSIGLWTTVEWQDAAGNWHLVEGWQGTLEPDQTKTWWVAEADRGKGPFRWAVYDQRGGKSMGSSQAFYLPASNRQRVEIELTVIR